MRTHERTRRWRGVLRIPAGGWLALVSFLTLVPGRAEAQEALKAGPESVEVAAQPAPPAEPEFKPGIPGLKMVDVRDHKQLWRDIEELQVRESGHGISIAEYRRQAIDKTSLFLGLEGAAADRFMVGASEEVAKLREAFLRTRRADAETGPGADPFSADLAAAAARLGDLLGQKPRHQLFLPDGKKWLLRLAFGPREDREAKEVKEAKETPEEPKAKSPKR